jgi:hypothetical protein
MKKIFFGLLITLLLFLGVSAIQHAYINVDHLGKGKLNSVTIVCLDLLGLECTTQTSTITDQASLDKLESIFFMKITTNLAFTKEKGYYEFIFNYQNASIDFNVWGQFKNLTAKIKYAARTRDYALSKTDIEYLATLFN